MKINLPLAILALCIAALTSCATPRGLTLNLSSPWGDVSSLDGQTTVALRPIVIPDK